MNVVNDNDLNNENPKKRTKTEEEIISILLNDTNWYYDEKNLWKANLYKNGLSFVVSFNPTTRPCYVNINDPTKCIVSVELTIEEADAIHKVAAINMNKEDTKNKELVLSVLKQTTEGVNAK